MPELLEKLTAREKEKFTAEQDAVVRAREAATKVTKASEELMEMKRAHEQELFVVKAQYEKRIRDKGYSCRQQLHRARDELSAAEAQAESAESSQKKAELCAANLSLKLRDLQAHLDRRTVTAEECLAALEQMMHVRLKRVTEQADNRIMDMMDHAKEVHSVSNLAVGDVTTELQDQMSRAHHRAEGRTRFKDLCELAKNKRNYDISDDGYQHLKNHLIGLWHVQSKTLPTSQST